MKFGPAIVIGIFVLAAIWATGEPASEPALTKFIDQTIVPSKYDERIIQLDRESIEAAYRTQVEHLFEVWMKDERGQPLRAVTGVINARKAYVGAMTEIERRERLLKEKPQP